MKVFEVRIAIGNYDFDRFVKAASLEKALEKSLLYGERKAKKENRPGKVQVVRIEETRKEFIP